MKVAVVGGSGFIGSHLCASLAAQNYQVLATTRSPGPVDGVAAGVEYRQLDLFDAGALSSFDLGGAQCLVYLAARTHVLRESSADPLAAYRRLNVEAALDMARLAASQGVGRFVYLSSIGVNGIASTQAFTETDPPAPREPYARSKLEAELALRDFCAPAGLELVILRPVLVYGSGAPGNFARLLGLVESGRPLPLKAIDNRRSLVAVENLVQLIEICIRHPRAAGEVFLVADGDDVSTAELVREIGAALGKPARLIALPLWLLRLGARLAGKTRELDRLCGSLQADSSKARELLGWRPRLTRREALRQLRPED